MFVATPTGRGWVEQDLGLNPTTIGRAPMNISSRTTLIGLNLALASALGVALVIRAGANHQAPTVRPGALLESAAMAQAPAPAARPRGQYVLLSGRMQGGSGAAVWVLDSVNQELLAMSWDRTRARFAPLGVRNVNADSLAAENDRGR